MCVCVYIYIYIYIYVDTNHLDMFIISQDTDVCKLVCECNPCIGGSVGGQNCLPFMSMFGCNTVPSSVIRNPK